jgi:PleD family two-component response regulator
MSELLARRLDACFEECSRRTELLAALVRAGGLPASRAARIVRAELGALESRADLVGLESLAQTARALQDLVGHLGGIDETLEPDARDVVVLDDNEITRELLALAIQAEGHRVRVAASVDELMVMVSERRPHIVLTEACMPGAPETEFCHFLRRAMSMESVPIVLFSSAQGQELAALAAQAGADLYLSKDQGIAELTRELGRLFEDIIW